MSEAIVILHRRSDEAGSPPPSQASSERGAVVVEMALILPVFMMLLLGIISAGTVYNDQLSLAHAAREGARYGAILSPDQSFDSGTWATNARDRVIARSADSLGSPSSTTCVSLVSGATATTYSGTHGAAWYSTNPDGSPCDPTDTYLTSTNDDGLRIQVVVTRQDRWDIGLTSQTITLRSSIVLQSEFAA